MPGGAAPHAALLLDWYDAHARVLPWRVGPAERRAGLRPDPYRVWLSEVMLQQTTVAAVEGYFRRFTDLWPDVGALAAADPERVMAAWAGLGYYARARNLLACARTVEGPLGGVFPDTVTQLRSLPGIGPYTAAAIAAIAFDRPEPVMDGNVERVMARLFAVEEPLPGAKGALQAHTAAMTPTERPGDYAQAVMDLGATICTPRAPDCGHCPWAGCCAARAAGIAPQLPRKTPKLAKPVRRGAVWIARRADGAWLLERRPPRGLLGGMLGWPGTAWGGEESGTDAPPLSADWQAAGEVRHTFTHFHLILTVLTAPVGPDSRPVRGMFLEPGAFGPSDLPTLMRKAFDLARAEVR